MGRSKRFGDRGPGSEPRTPDPESQTPKIYYRQLDSGSEDARSLFDYAAVWIPPAALSYGVGAWDKDRMIGAVLLEQAGREGMIYRPVVTGAENPIDAAAGLISTLLSHLRSLGVETLFARPQGLDRVWVRLGFIPVPEADLPSALRGRPGAGLFGWRGGSAIWSSRAPSGDKPADPR